MLVPEAALIYACDVHPARAERPALRRLRAASSCALSALAALVLLVPAHQSGHAASPEKIAIFAIDAADWHFIDPLVATGELPTFARLKKVGATGILKAEPPLLSPIIWTTIATGRQPEDHGVLDFMVDVPGGGQAPVGGSARRVKALWEIWSKAGRNVLVTGWWATWPADHVQGAVMSDRIATPHLRDAARPDTGLVYPPGRWAEIAKHIVAPDAIDYDALSAMFPLTRTEFERALVAERKSTAALYQDPIAHYRAALAAARTYRRLSVELIPSVHPDLWVVYYELVDTACHLFIRDANRARGEAAIRSAYVEMDRALAEAARALDPSTLIVVLSDHGFQPATAAITEDPADLTTGASGWHRPAGIIAAATAGAIAGRETAPLVPLGTVSPLDVAPTLLARAGLAVAEDMPGRLISALVPAGARVARVASYGAHDVPDLARTGGGPGSAAELERLRALGYISGNTPPSSLARVNLGEILYRRGDYRGALRELEALMRADPRNLRGAMWLARTCVALGRPDDALRIYDRQIQAMAAGGTRIDPLIFLAATDLDLGARRVDAAAARLQRVPATLAGAPEVLTARGAVAEAERKPVEAQRQYWAALAAQPADADALGRLVDLLLGTGQIAAADEAATKAARTYTASPAHLSIAGETALAAHRYRDAERHFESALALAPDAASVRIDLARARLLDGRADAALDALAGVPARREVEMIRGAALARQNDWPGAAAALERAAASGPATPELLNALGNAQLRAGRASDAAKTFERSLALDPNQPDVRALLEQARRKQ
jgi:tetratricopeptide (TPR) repeat protein